MKAKSITIQANIPSVAEFADQYPQYGNVAQNEFSFIFNLLMTSDAYNKGKVATLDLELPAVAGIAKVCYEAVEANANVEWSGFLKQFIGATMCSLMTANEFEKTGRKRAIPHHGFTKGEMYRLIGSDE